jgi:hypothetical protein
VLFSCAGKRLLVRHEAVSFSKQHALLLASEKHLPLYLLLVHNYRCSNGTDHPFGPKPDTTLTRYQPDPTRSPPCPGRPDGRAVYEPPPRHDVLGTTRPI